MKRTAALLSLMATSLVAFAQEDPARYPSKPIEMSVSSAPGGGLDSVLRKISQNVESLLGKPVIILNQPGKFLAINNLARARADGYSLGNISLLQAVFLPHQEAVPYDTKKDFTWIAQALEYNLGIVVHADAPWKTFKEFVDAGKNNPRGLTYGDTSPQGAYQAMITAIALKEKSNLVYVPYKTTAEYMPAILRRDVDAIYSLGGLKPFYDRKQIRVLVVDSPKRVSWLPDVPTFDELGYPRNGRRFTGIIGPAGIPEPIRAKLDDVYKRAINEPSVAELMGKFDMALSYMDSRSFRDTVFADYDRMAGVLKELAPHMKLSQ